MKKAPVVVYTSGSWDLFHIGHLNVLERSKALGDTLVVGVSTDKLVEAYKGMKPTIPYAERRRILQALRCVDKVVKQTVLTDVRILKRHSVDIVTIGDDWKSKYLKGLAWMKARGRRVVYLPYTKGVSTTATKRKIIQNAYNLIRAELQREVEAGRRWQKKCTARRP